MPDPINHIDQCDDVWLSDVLGRAVAIADIEAVGVGVGLLGEVHRVVLDGDAGPPSVIVKLGAEANADIAVHFGYYEREWGAYRDLLPDSRVAAPGCWFNSLVDDRPCLVLEDLADHRRGDQVEGITPADAEAAIDLAADLHSGFWDDERLGSLSWMPGPEDPRVAGYGHLFEMMWDQFRTGAGVDVPSDVVDAARAAMAGFDAVVAGFGSPPVTVVHGDFRLDNLLFAPDGRAVAIDWQLTARGRGPYDLAFLLAGSATTDVRRELERVLIERYHARLVNRGVQDYPLESCWDDYRRGHIQNLPNPVTAAVVVDPGNDRGRELLRRNAERALTAVADLWG
ncbi:MAG: ecdysteroid 22-kinase family protein [Acidimicrobiia bacterium]|nr:ecdysteroid 22-kinase family protein [Acidimicrobiia bacterium]